MKPIIEIRRAGEDNSTLLARLIRDSFRDVAERFSLNEQNCPKHPSNCTKEWIFRDFSRGVAYFVMYRDGSPVGCVGLEAPNDEVRYLERLAVLPAYRRKGLGQALVSQAVSQATREGARSLGIGIIAAHEELRDWYRRLGFVEMETKTFPHLPFAVTLMSLSLDPENATKTQRTPNGFKPHDD